MKSTKIRLSPSLQKFFLLATDGKLVQQILDGFSAIYRGFLARRYGEFSRGGGDWPPLAKETIKARRRKRKAGGEKILIDTAILKNAVSIQTGASLTPKFGPGGRNEVSISRRMVTIGFSGATHSGKGTVEEIAEAHQTGAGYLPVREIIVEPDEKTMGQMVRMAENTIQGYPK